ncbi:MAG: hypothetical protein OES79_04285, partial [Planctomycetota bacterium]|nr:hypothetical protein [Planctomycetota bacterium]
MSTAISNTNPAGKRRASRARESQQGGGDPVPWYRATAGLGMLGAVAFWLSQPPVDWGVLGWLAPVFWLLLIQQTQLSGRRPYLALYLVGLVYWAASTYWLTLPQ